MIRERSEYLQCCHCGAIHKQKIKCSNDDLYINDVKCDRCKHIAKHLRCGTDPTDIYIYYDNTLDLRYY